MWISFSLKSVKWTLITVCIRSASFWSAVRRHIWALRYGVPTIPLCLCKGERERVWKHVWVQKMLISSILLWIKWDDGLHCVLFSAVGRISFQIGSLFNTSLAWPLPSYAVQLIQSQFAAQSGLNLWHSLFWNRKKFVLFRLKIYLCFFQFQT